MLFVFAMVPPVRLLGAPLLFTMRRVRPVAFAVGIGFHLATAAMMKDLIYFSVQMRTFYALFLSSEEWRRIGRWLRRRAVRAA